MSEVLFSKIDQIGEPEQRKNEAIIIKIVLAAIIMVSVGWFFYNVFATNTDIFNGN